MEYMYDDFSNIKMHNYISIIKKSPAFIGLFFILLYVFLLEVCQRGSVVYIPYVEKWRGVFQQQP